MGLLFCMGRATRGGLALVRGGLFRAWRNMKLQHDGLHLKRAEKEPGLFTLWSTTPNTMASSSRAMAAITTMNQSSWTTWCSRRPPSARSPPATPPPPPGGVGLGESGENRTCGKKHTEQFLSFVDYESTKRRENFVNITQKSTNRRVNVRQVFNYQMLNLNTW